MKKMMVLFLILAVLLVNAVPFPGLAAVTVPSPTQFKAVINATYVDLSWASPGSSVTHTYIERSTDFGEFYTVATPQATTATYRDPGISNGHVYRYRAKHVNGQTSSAYTSEIELVYLYPTGLSSSGLYSDQINLSWTYPVLMVNRTATIKTHIERREEGQSNWVTAYEAPYPETEYRDTGLKPDTLYHYRIRTQYGENSYSNYYPYSSYYSYRTTIALSTALSGFALSGNQIRLEWDPSMLNGYTPILQRMDATGAYNNLPTGSVYDHYNDTGLTPGKAYAYRIYLRSNSGVASPLSEMVEVFTETIAAPFNISALPAAGGKVAVFWEYPFDVESGFEVWRKETGGLWQKLDVCPKNITSYTDYSAEAGKSYTYRVRAYRGSNVYSAFSTSSLLNNADPSNPPPLQIAGLDGYVLVATSDAPAGIKYVLEMRQSINDHWVDYYQVEGGSFLAYLFPSAGDSYDLRLRSENKGNASFGPVYHFFGSVPEPPSGISVLAVGSNRVVLSWKDVTEKEDGYRIYRTVGNDRRMIAKLPKDAQRYADTTVTPGTKVSYDVVAYNPMGESGKITMKGTVPQKPAFTDLASVSWAMDGIQNLCAMGAITQSGDKLFYPARSITRAEFVTMLMKTYAVETTGDFLFSLSDVSRTNWYYPYMMTAVKHKLIIPDEKRSVRPSQALTRLEMASILANFAAYREKMLNSYSTDILNRYSDGYIIGEDDRGLMASLAGDSILPPQGGYRLQLNETVSRAEAAACIYKYWRVYP